MASTHAEPSTLSVVLAVGRVTFCEVIRDKILYNSVLIAVLLLGVAVLASRLSFISPQRIVLDFGISAINLTTSAIGALIGAGLLLREFERRTIYLALSHPISRMQFIIGKFFGLSAVICLNWLLLCLVFLSILWMTADGQVDVFNPTLLIALPLLLMQALVIAALAMFFSSFSTASLSIMFTIGIYLIGNNISQLRIVAVRMKATLLGGGLDAISRVLPNLEHFNLGTKVTYGLPVTWQFVATSFLYGVSLLALLMFLAGLMIQRREV
jgi:Cu-processing system permease protein